MTVVDDVQFPRNRREALAARLCLARPRKRSDDLRARHTRYNQKRFSRECPCSDKSKKLAFFVLAHAKGEGDTTSRATRKTSRPTRFPISLEGSMDQGLTDGQPKYCEPIACHARVPVPVCAVAGQTRPETKDPRYLRAAIPAASRFPSLRSTWSHGKLWYISKCPDIDARRTMGVRHPVPQIPTRFVSADVHSTGDKRPAETLSGQVSQPWVADPAPPPR